MTLAALIKKGGLSGYATATHATNATTYEQGASVATVATVAVADLTNSNVEAETHEPFNRDAFDERTAIIEANGVPRAWAKGYAVLCTMPRPSTYAPDRWQQIMDDGGYFLDQWGRQAAALGWRAMDVFGVNPDAPEFRYDGMGLVPLLAGRSVIAITGDTARINCGTGVHMTFYRKTMTADAVVLWGL